MALNDTFTIQEVNLDKKDLSFDNKLKKIEAYCNNECTENPSNNQCKIFCDFFLILNPYNFVPLTAHIKLEINYSNELEHRCS